MTGHEHPRPESTSAAVDEPMLEDFLNQHLLGSRSGVKAFRAAEQTWAGTPLVSLFSGNAWLLMVMLPRRHCPKINRMPARHNC